MIILVGFIQLLLVDIIDYESIFGNIIVVLAFNVLISSTAAIVLCVTMKLDESTMCNYEIRREYYEIIVLCVTMKLCYNSTRGAPRARPRPNMSCKRFEL